MKLKIRKQIIKLLLLFSLVTPFSFANILPNISFSKDYAPNYFEYNSTSYSSSNFILSESNDDIEETSFFNLTSISISSSKEYISIALHQNIVLLQKIPFKLLSIPPPIS